MNTTTLDILSRTHAAILSLDSLEQFVRDSTPNGHPAKSQMLDAIHNSRDRIISGGDVRAAYQDARAIVWVNLG